MSAPKILRLPKPPTPQQQVRRLSLLVIQLEKENEQLRKQLRVAGSSVSQVSH